MLNQSRHLREKMLPFQQAVELGVIEAGIWPLVQALRDFGFTPLASCEGHLPYTICTAYVMFSESGDPSKPKTRSLARLLNELARDGALAWSWSVTGCFTENLELAFCLRAESNSLVAKWVPIGLRADITTLSEAISQILVDKCR